MTKLEFREEMYDVSLIGVTAYGILCFENYVKSKYPDKNWSILFDELWKITSVRYIDEDWGDPLMEKIPKYLFEFKTFEESHFDYIDKSTYDKFVKFYQDVLDDKNIIIITDIIVCSICDYLYGAVTDHENILQMKHIKLLIFYKKIILYYQIQI